jgi:hypothetical protein
VTLRAGADRRELPFGVRGSPATETALAFGFGAPFAQGRASLDFSASRANRSADNVNLPPTTSSVFVPAVKASESAWIISLGLTVRY